MLYDLPVGKGRHFLNRGGVANPNLDPILAPLGLTKDEVRDLVAFLKAL